MRCVQKSLVLALLLASISACVGLIKLPIHRKPKTLKQYLHHARNEARSHSMLHTSSMDPPPVAIIGILNSDYYCNVSIGTPPQQFSVLLNTAIAGLWVPSSQCPVPKYSICKEHRRYNQNKSSTYSKEGEGVELGGMVAELGYDTVSLGGQDVTNQSFAEVIRYMFSDVVPYDGMLGLNVLQDIFHNDSSIFFNMVQQGIINQTVYGLYYNKNLTQSSNAGGLIIGGRDESLYSGDLLYINSTSAAMWRFNMKNLLVYESGMAPLCRGSGCEAVPASGSHFISANHRDMDYLHKSLGGTVYSDDFTYQFNCSVLHKLKPLLLTIGNSFFRLSPLSYVDKVMADGKLVCLSAFVGLDDIAGDSWYLGDAFFSSIYVEFDVDNQRMGFAQSVYSST